MSSTAQLSTLNAPIITATTPTTGYSQRRAAGSGTAAAVGADTVMAAAV